jgi:hypothetical protein
MGITIVYFAIPPKCSLYQRLQKEESLFVLALNLINSYHTIFDKFDFDPDILKDSIEAYPQIFNSEMEVDEAIAELRYETMETCKIYSGIGKRKTSLEKTYGEVEEYLLQSLKGLKTPNASDVAEEMMFGAISDKSFMPPKLKDLVDPMNLISQESIIKNAQTLRQIDLGLIDFQSDQSRKDFRDWRKFYLSVAENNEEILVRVI